MLSPRVREELRRVAAAERRQRALELVLRALGVASGLGLVLAAVVALVGWGIK